MVDLNKCNMTLHDLAEDLRSLYGVSGSWEVRRALVALALDLATDVETKHDAATARQFLEQCGVVI